MIPSASSKCYDSAPVEKILKIKLYEAEFLDTFTRADAKRTSAYFLGPSSIGPILKLSVL